MTKKRRKRDEHENHERWLVSYADFITLLFAFFITMYALSAVNEGKYRVLSESLSNAFNPSVSDAQKMKIGPTFPKEDNVQELATTAFKKTFSADYKKVQTALSALEEGNKASVNIEKRGVVISLSEQIIFEAGKADIIPEAKAVIDEVAAVLREMTNHVRIEGHSDNIPIHTPQFPSNWELSSARALNILRYMVDIHRFNPGKLSATGYGEFRPLVSNETADGRAKNRRVDIVVLNSEGVFNEP